MQSLRDPSRQDYVTTLVYEFAVAWDGKILTADGKRRLDIRLTLDLDDGHFWWSMPVVGDLREDVLTATSSGTQFEVILTTDVYSAMCEVTGLPPVTAALLKSGLVARGANCVVALRPAPVLALTGNSDANGLLSVDVIRAYDEYVLLVAAERAAIVTDVLDKAANSGWRRLPEAATRERVGSDFVVFTEVVFSDDRRFDDAVRALPGVVAASLRLGSGIVPEPLSSRRVVDLLAPVVVAT